MLFLKLGQEAGAVSRSKRFFNILLTVLIVLIVGYFIFAGTQVEPPELPDVEDAREAVSAV